MLLIALQEGMWKLKHVIQLYNGIIVNKRDGAADRELHTMTLIWILVFM